MNGKKCIEAIKITPAAMSIASAVELYKHLTPEGKGGFVACFNPDDADLLRQALAEAGEELYTPGGLHRIDGVCVALPAEIENPDDPIGEYRLKTDDRTYLVFLNLPLGDRYVPENDYPKVGEKVVVYAEQILQDGVGDDAVYLGYAESCWIVRSDADVERYADAQQVAIISVKEADCEV